MELPDCILDAARELVEDDLVPAALARSTHPYFDVYVTRDHGGPSPELHPFLLTTPPDPKVLAGWCQRSLRSEVWFLPADVRRPEDWVAAAIRRWAIAYGQFPLVGGWWEQEPWQTRPEVDASFRRASFEIELVETTVRLKAEIGNAEVTLHEARRQAALGLRRILTEKGDALKAAVYSAFDQLGYKVVDRDEDEPPDVAGRIEDLGLTDPDEPGFDPIVEVKGYDSGARAGDFGSMMRHLVRAEHAGRAPTAIWWVPTRGGSEPQTIGPSCSLARMPWWTRTLPTTCRSW